MIIRQRLIALLDEHAQTPVTLVCAPAGYGKTTLLASWAANPSARQGSPAVWVSLDRYDNDPFRLWSAILAALQTVEGAGTGLDELSPPTGRMEPGFLTALVNAVDGADGADVIYAAEDLIGADATAAAYARPGFVWLILDDLHHSRNPDVADSLEMLLTNLPRRLRVIFTSRSDPPLPALRKLRLAGLLTEIRSRDLAFTRQEAVDLLAGHGVRLTSEDLGLVLARTEGWPAALRLAGISLAEDPDPAAVVAQFVTDDRTVADYLFGEALSRLSPDVLRFVLVTSVCERFTLDLAETLTGQPAADILDRLEADALVVRTGPDRRWYRYPALLRSYANARTLREHTAEAAHATAAVWFADHGDVAAALGHSVSSGDADIITALLDAHGPHLVLRGETRLLSWQLDALPDAVLNRPAVTLVAAAVALDLGEIDTADGMLARIAAVASELDERQRIRYAVLRLQRATRDGEVPAALAKLAEVFGAETGDVHVDVPALTARGTAEFALGDSAGAEFDLRRASELAHSAGYDYVELYCLNRLAGVAFATDRFIDLGTISARAMELVDARGWAGSPRSTHAYATFAWSAYMQMDFETGWNYAAKALASLGAAPDPFVALSARCVEAACRFELDDRHAALRDWRRAWADHGRCLNPAGVAFNAMIQVRMAVTLGELQAAEEAIDRIRPLAGTEAEVNLFRAQIGASRGRREPARRLLRPVLSGELPPLSVTTLMKAWTLEAVLATEAGETEAGRRALDTALDIAEPRGALREFCAEGRPLRDILVRDLGRFRSREPFVRAAVAAIGTAATPLAEPLSPRERELLAELPSMRTVNEIATTMFISASTVKTHLRSIYAKLGVSRRRDAVAISRQRGLI